VTTWKGHHIHGNYVAQIVACTLILILSDACSCWMHIHVWMHAHTVWYTCLLRYQLFWDNRINDHFTVRTLVSSNSYTSTRDRSICGTEFNLLERPNSGSASVSPALELFIWTEGVNGSGGFPVARNSCGAHTYTSLLAVGFPLNCSGAI